MKANIAVLKGDGIGPEVIREALKCLEAVQERFGHVFSLEEGLIGAAAIDEVGVPFPEETKNICHNSQAILFGAIGHPKYDNDPKAKVRPEQGLLAMRKELGLYANIRPVKSYPQLLGKSPLKEDKVKGVDFTVFRELTGGIYFGQPRGRSEDGDTAFDTCQYHRNEIQRIAELAFRAASARRGHLTLVDKANVLATSRLWRETVKDVSANYTQVTLDFMFVDNAAMQLIQNPGRFDVILTENMFGDIITDEASVLTGSMGMLPSASVGSGVALYEPIHGSYPEVAGLNKANPMAAILSLAMMMEYSFDLRDEAETIREAVLHCIEQEILTEELQSNSPSSTSQVGDAIASRIDSEKLADLKRP